MCQRASIGTTYLSRTIYAWELVRLPIEESLNLRPKLSAKTSSRSRGYSKVDILGGKDRHDMMLERSGEQ